MSQHLLTISDDCKILQLQWKANNQRKEIILLHLIISLKRKRNDLIINLEQRILIKMILKRQRLITIEAILMITEQNLIHNSPEIQQDHELQTQHFSFTQIGTKLSFINCIENVTTLQNLLIFVSKTMESSILTRTYLQSHENLNKSWEYFQRNMKTEQNNSKMQITLKLHLRPSINKTQKTLALHLCMRNVLKQWNTYMKWQVWNHTWSNES